MRHQVVLEGGLNTTPHHDRHDHDQYAHNKLYSVQIRPSQPESDPIGDHPRVQLECLDQGRVKGRHQVVQRRNQGHIA